MHDQGLSAYHHYPGTGFCLKLEARNIIKHKALIFSFGKLGIAVH